MLNKILIGTVFVLMNNITYAQTNDSTDVDVLMLYGENFNQDTQYTILNKDKTVFAKIGSKNGNEPDCVLLENKILAYYPDYYMFHFYLAGLTENNYCRVKIGNDEKLVMRDSTMKMMSIKEYLRIFYCKASKDNPLREEPNLNGRIIQLDYNDCCFRCLEIEGNWIKVESVNDEENEQLYADWLMWKNDGKIVLDYPYVW